MANKCKNKIKKAWFNARELENVIEIFNCGELRKGFNDIILCEECKEKLK